MTIAMGHTQTATFSIMAGLLLVASGSGGAAVAHTSRSRASLLSATSICAHRPAVATSTSKNAQSATRADAVGLAEVPESSASATPSQTASASPSASPSPSASDSPSPTPSASPKPSATSPASDDPTPTASPTPSSSPSPSPTPSPTPSPSPTPTTPQLCVLVQPFSKSTVYPGGTASYKIFVWSTGAESDAANVTVGITKVADVDAPGFTVCSQPSGDVCTVGDLLTSQSDELVAAANVRTSASAGEKIILTATVRASKATSFDAKATIDVVASTSGSTSTSENAGDSLPGTSAFTPSDGGLTSPVDGTNPSGLFPTVSPASAASTGGKAGKNQTANDAAIVSSTLPLNSRLVGGQLAGLALLAAAIAIAIARLSLRTERPHNGGGPAK
jgi:hypothetical protein